MKTLVTGGTGFIGSNLANKLLADGHEVFVTGLEQNPNPKFINLGGDFHDLDWGKLGRLDVLFHQAAINDTTLKNRTEMFRINVDWPKELFKQVVQKGCRHIVYASSTAVYGNVPPPYREDGPTEALNVYAESKLDFDDFVVEFAKKNPTVVIVGLRYCNVYGPGENKKGKRATMIYQLAQQMFKGNPRIFKYGEQKRDYIYIKDVILANLLASKAQESCIVNCGFGEAVSFNRLVEILNSVLGTNRNSEYFDNPHEGSYQNFTECDMTYAKEKIGFVPKFDIEKGITDYFKSGFLTQE